MSELRDARFARALASAPDARMQPAAAVRQAIQQAARQAAAQAAPWWKRRLFPAPSQRMPWNAAFATLLLAGMVTLLWHDREIPGAVSDTPVAPKPVPAQVQPAPAAPVAAAPAAPAAPAAAQPKPRATAGAPARKAAEAPRERVEAPAPLAKAEPDKEKRQADMASASGNIAAESRSAAPPPVPAAAPAAAPAPAPAMRAAAPAMQKSFAAPAWTLARITIDGRSVEVAREQSGRLSALLAITAAARSNEPLMEPPGASVQLLDATGPQGLLEIAGPQIRWTPAGGDARTGRPDPAQLQSLMEEIRRLAPR